MAQFLTEQEVRAICRRLAVGESPAEIAPDFSCGKANIYAIRDGRSWTKVSGDYKLERFRTVEDLKFGVQEQLAQLASPFDSYWVSNRGRLFSTKGRFARELSGVVDHNGYRAFRLTSNREHTAKKYAHQLVAEAFLGPALPGHEACHVNDVPNDNRVENLRWGTHAENMQDAVRNERLCVGEDRQDSKLTEDDVRKIRRRRRRGESFGSIAKDFPVSRSNIRMVAIGATWKHVEVS